MGWEHRGIGGEGDPPPGVGKHKGTLLIIGSGRCVWDDLREYLPAPIEQTRTPIAQSLREWVEPGAREVMAINQIGLELNCPVAHYASLHAGSLLLRYALRMEFGLPCAGTVLHSDQAYQANYCLEHLKINSVWPFGPLRFRGLLSGGFAVLVGLCLGYDRIVLAGCPNDSSGRFCDEPDQAGAYEQPVVIEQWHEIIEQFPEIRARVRSMSGNTREWLGGPQ